MINGIGSYGRHQVRFGNISSEELNRKQPEASANQQPVATSSLGAQSTETGAESEAPKKSHKGLYITLGTLAAVTGLIIAGKKGVFGEGGKVQELASKVADPVTKFYTDNVKPKVSGAWEWTKDLFGGKKASAAEATEKAS